LFTSNARYSMSPVNNDPTKVQLSGTLEYVLPINNSDIENAVIQAASNNSFTIEGGKLQTIISA